MFNEMIDHNYLNSLLDTFHEIKRTDGRVGFNMLVTLDKHYPGIKKITLSDFEPYGIKNSEYWYTLEYGDICKVFKTNRYKFFMKSAAKYFYNNNNFIQQHLEQLDPISYERLYNRTPFSKNIYMKMYYANFKTDIVDLFDDIFKHVEQHQYQISDIRDLYVKV